MPVRLTIKEKTFKLRISQIGDTRARASINRKLTKASFYLKDPRIDAIAALELGRKPEGP